MDSVVCDWKDFSAFNGKLRPYVLRNEGPARKLSLKEMANKFAVWLRNLRLKPKDYGIPDDQVRHVLLLLDTFFKPLTQGNPGFTVMRVNTSVTGFEATQIAPVTVTLGEGEGFPVHIADAAAALGYVFSVARPCVKNDKMPTWQNYYLPLTVTYCWCTYLAFIWSFDKDKQLPAEVPVMACSMYISYPTLTTPTFSIGSTWRGDRIGAAAGAQELKTHRNMDDWRRADLLEDAMSHLKIRFRGAKRLPPLDAGFREQAARWLFYRIIAREWKGPEWKRTILGVQPGSSAFEVKVLNKETGKAVKDKRGEEVIRDGSFFDFITVQADRVKNDLKTDDKDSPVETEQVAYDRLDRHELVRNDLFELLYRLVDARFDPAYDPRDPALYGMWQQLLEFCLTPHAFLMLPNKPAKKFTVRSESVKAIKDASEVLFRLSESLLEAKLDALYRFCKHESPMEEEYYIYLKKPWGRCAETYPTVTMMYVRRWRG